MSLLPPGFNLWTWLFYTLPWWAQAFVALLAVLALLAGAVKVFGFQRVKPFILPLLTVIGALAALARERQAGYRQREEIQKKAQEAAVDDFEKVKKDVEAKPISEVDRDNQKWLKP